MNTIAYYATFVFEVTTAGVEILESTMNTIDPDYFGSEDLLILEDIVKENSPKQDGIYKRIEFGSLIYQQDYWSDWNFSTEIEKESLTKFTPEQEEEYLKKYN